MDASQDCQGSCSENSVRFHPLYCGVSPMSRVPKSSSPCTATSQTLRKQLVSAPHSQVYLHPARATATCRLCDISSFASCADVKRAFFNDTGSCECLLVGVLLVPFATPLAIRATPCSLFSNYYSFALHLNFITARPCGGVDRTGLRNRCLRRRCARPPRGAI